MARSTTTAPGGNLTSGLMHSDLQHAHPSQVRHLIRRGQWTGPTAGLAVDYAQANVVIVPAACADDFEQFCRRNPRPCPLLERLPPGEPHPRQAAADADLRTDVPRYRVFHTGKPLPDEPLDIVDLWRDDLVTFLLGCSFTFDRALVAGGVPVRHVQQGRNVPMYRTNRLCRPAGLFAGPLVVSMRPVPAEFVERAVAITAGYPRMHGAPIHVGDPAALGIANLNRPDFGDPVNIYPGEVPMFWACGVTPQLAMLEAGPELAITHSPGCMFLTDWLDQAFWTRLGE
jgi:uncharacterized protein YcsI (UPF0317 family)